LKTILDVKRSFNHTSTASRLMFVRFPPSHHHHLHHHHPSSLSTTLKTRHGAPPLSGGMWAQTPTPQLTSEAGTKPQSPLPFPKGCGQLILARRRNRGDGKMRGDPGIGRPMRYVMKHEPRQTSWPFLFVSCHPNDHFLPKPNVTNDQRLEFPPQPYKPHQMVPAPSFDAT